MLFGRKFMLTKFYHSFSKNFIKLISSNFQIDEEPLAFMTLEAISNELLMREKAKQHDPAIVQKRRSLPVFNHREEILKAIEENPVVLIKGTTGCGKSTQVCV